MLSTAIKYVHNGFSVIPLNGKIPAIEWKEYQTRFPNDEELELWFADGKKNIGIVTGEISGITVVDIDAKSGGLETLKKLHLPLTWTVKTGGGGWHYYYKYDKRASQTAGIYQGIDIRNDGGQVVAPNSTHPKTGLKYRWAVKEDELVDFPIGLFNKKEIIKKDWATVLNSGTAHGNRNDLAASLFGKLFHLFKPEEWETSVYQLVQAWNLKNNPPLSEKELRTIYESIAKKDLNKRVPSLWEIINRNYTPEDIAEKIKEKNRQVKKFFSWGNADFDEVFPLIELNTYAVLFGQFSSGKTTFAMFMARKNAEAGHKVCFLTLEMSKERLIRQYSFKRAGVKKEQYKKGEYTEDIFDTFSKELKNIDYIGIDELSNKVDYSLEDIEEIVKTKKPDIIFIDNFNKLKGSGGSEVDIDNKTSTKLLNITRRFPVAIVVIHHANKPSKEKKKNILKGIGGLRGTNKINDDADIVVEIGRPSEEQITDENKNLTVIGVYKDRDWDSRGIHNLTFNDGLFELKKDKILDDIAEFFGGKVMPDW